MTEVMGFPLWPILALVFSFFGAVIIGYNQIFKLDGRELAVWRVVGMVPVVVASLWVVPWPTEVGFYAVSGAIGIATVVGDVLLMNACSTYGGRLASMYVPMKMMLAFVMWGMIDPDSLSPLLREPWKMVVVLGCFGVAAWGMNHIRRNDWSLKALVAVVPSAVIFASADVIEKYVLPSAHATPHEVVGASMAMLAMIFGVGVFPALVWLGGWPVWNTRTVVASAGFGFILMVGITLLLVTFVVAPNPGYVAAVTCLSTVWLSVYGRYVHGEQNNVVAVLMLAAAAVGVVLVTA